MSDKKLFVAKAINKLLFPTPASPTHTHFIFLCPSIVVCIGSLYYCASVVFCSELNCNVLYKFKWRRGVSRIWKYGREFVCKKKK